MCPLVICFGTGEDGGRFVRFGSLTRVHSRSHLAENRSPGSQTHEASDGAYHGIGTGVLFLQLVMFSLRPVVSAARG